MSELTELDPPYAPSMTFEQCTKRSVALMSVIDRGWAFVQFMQKLDPTMRLSYLNYLHTHPHSLNVCGPIEEAEVEPFTEIKDYTLSVSPKKRSKKNVSKKILKKPSRITV